MCIKQNRFAKRNPTSMHLPVLSTLVYRLITGKVEIGIFFCLNGDIGFFTEIYIEYM